VNFHEFLNSVKILSAESSASLQSHRLQPELCDLIVSLNMNMSGLIAVARVKEKPIRTKSQYGWHLNQHHYYLSSLTARTAEKGSDPFSP